MFRTAEKWAGRVSALTILLAALGWAFGQFPKEIKPASERYVDEKVEPIDQLAYDSAVKGISWANDEKTINSGKYTAEYLHEQLCGNRKRKITGYYRTYERITGSKHPAEGARCD